MSDALHFVLSNLHFRKLRVVRSAALEERGKRILGTCQFVHVSPPRLYRVGAPGIHVTIATSYISRTVLFEMSRTRHFTGAPRQIGFVPHWVRSAQVLILKYFYVIKLIQDFAIIYKTDLFKVYK